MARLTIKKYKNNNPQNSGYGKTYTRLKPIEALTTDVLSLYYFSATNLHNIS